MKPPARLQRRADFRRLYQEGVSLANQRVVLYLRREDGETRVGFVAGRKLGSAVVRNRAKRLLREVVRLHRSELPDGYHLLLVARRGLVGATYRQAERSVLEILRRAGLGKGERK